MNAAVEKPKPPERVMLPRARVQAGNEVPDAPDPRPFIALLHSFRWNTVQVLLSESFTVWQRHNGSRLAASLSF